MIRIAVVDDDPFVRQALAEHISRVSDQFHVTGTFPSVSALLDHAREQPIDVVLLDVMCKETTFLIDNDLTALNRNGIRIIITTVDTTRPEIPAAVRQHQASVVDKNDLNDQRLEMIVHLAADGGQWISADVKRRLIDSQTLPKLTPRHEQVLQRVLMGMPPQAIADELHLSAGTIYSYIDEIEQRFTDAGYPIRDPSEPTRKKAWQLKQKAIEIGYFAG